MGNILRKRKSYKLSKKSIASAIDNVPTGYIFEINGTHLDLSKFKINSDKNLDIGWAFARAIWIFRNELEPTSLKTYVQLLDRFFEYLRDEKPTANSIYDIDTDLLFDYIYWLKYISNKKYNYGSKFLSDTSKRKHWGVVSTIISRLQRESILSHEIDIPKNIFEKQNGNNYKTYSEEERKQLISACKKDILDIRSKKKCHTKSDDHVLSHLIPYAILITLRSGINPEVLFELPVTKHCIKKTHMSDSERLVLPIKKRSGKSQNITFNSSHSNDKCIRLKTRVTDLLREVEQHTSHLRGSLEKTDPLKEKLWLTEGFGKIAGFRERSYYLSLQNFAKRHNILSDDGKQLIINFRRLRPTFAEAILKANGGDIRDLQSRLGHSDIRTTMSYLDPNLEERKKAFAFSGKAMQVWALGESTAPDIKTIADELDIGIADAKRLVSGDYNMGAAKCKNPLKSPLRGIKEGDICTNYLACFRCGNCVVLKEDAHRLYSFYYWIEQKKLVLGKEKWEASYKWIIDIIDQDIAPKLGDYTWNERKKLEAKSKPFPLWILEKNGDVSAINTKELR